MALSPSHWDFLDKPSNETLPLLSLEGFTDIVNGCSHDALRRNSFVILRIVCMARYLELKTQEIHEALQDAHSAMSPAKIIPERPISATRLRQTDLASPNKTQRLPLDTTLP